jgi:hypothetical protein
MANRPPKITEEELEQLFRDDPMFAVQMLDSDYHETSGATFPQYAVTSVMTRFMMST